MDTPSPPAASAAPEPKRSLFETVVTSTPVLLTVIATFMVGQSTGEMTRAQYFRSVAGQNQSKVADQWGFYQAKRIRGQVLEGNADILLSQRRDPFTRDTLTSAAEAMVRELRAGSNGAGKAAGDMTALVASADKALADTRAALNPPASGWKGERHTLTPEGVQAALDALQHKSAKKPMGAKKSDHDANLAISTEQAKLLDEVITLIKKRTHDEDIAPIVLKVTDETLKQAIKEADARADEVYQRGKRIENVLEEFDAFIDRQTTLAFEYQQQVSRANGGAEAGKATETIQLLIARLQGDYKAARHAYSARRYEDDARSNQDSAYLYEVKVHLSAARSDKHLFRSKMFLFAMLVAQAGVTIATLAMAVKQRSVFWLLATLTGLIAIAFGLYVYLDLWPMPSF